MLTLLACCDPAGSMHTVDAVPLVPGNALMQCRVGDHIAAGMAALYSVQGEEGRGQVLAGQILADQCLAGTGLRMQ